LVFLVNKNVFHDFYYKLGNFLVHKCIHIKSNFKHINMQTLVITYFNRNNWPIINLEERIVKAFLSNGSNYKKTLQFKNSSFITGQKSLYY